MNNIIIADEKEIEIASINVNLKVDSKVANIICSGQNIINEINTEHRETVINVTLENGASLIYNRFDYLKKAKTELSIIVKEKAAFILVYSIYTIKDASVKVKVVLEDNKSKADIVIRGVSESGNLHIQADGIVNKDTIDTQILEDIKVLALDEGQAKIIPNMLINSNETIANHKASISKIDEKELFYLEAKGVSKLKAEELIKNGFLVSRWNNDLTIYSKVKEILKS